MGNAIFYSPLLRDLRGLNCLITQTKRLRPKELNMKWKQKSLLQNLIAKLPSKLSYAAYYFFKRNFGSSYDATPISHLTEGIKLARYIIQQGRLIDDKTFLEIGTGYRLNIPIVLWLLGASRIITVDLNPYLRAELVHEDISYMRHHKQEIQTLFEDIQSPGFAERFRQLTDAENNLPRLLNMTGIEYLAPADASGLDLATRSVDFHISYTTLEHIPLKTLKSIIREGKRLLRPGGLFVHCIDFSDHFSHSDNSILPINFLQFDDMEWERLAGNRYMYHNRLRVDDFANIFRDTDLRILSMDAIINEKAREELREGFPLDDRFVRKNIDTNATTCAWVVASNNENQE